MEALESLKEAVSIGGDVPIFDGSVLFVVTRICGEVLKLVAISNMSH